MLPRSQFLVAFFPAGFSNFKSGLFYGDTRRDGNPELLRVLYKGGSDTGYTTLTSEMVACRPSDVFNSKIRPPHEVSAIIVLRHAPGREGVIAGMCM